MSSTHPSPATLGTTVFFRCSNTNETLLEILHRYGTLFLVGCSLRVFICTSEKASTRIKHVKLGPAAFFGFFCAQNLKRVKSQFKGLITRKEGANYDERERRGAGRGGQAQSQ